MEVWRQTLTFSAGTPYIWVILGKKEKIFCFPLPDRSIENGPDPKNNFPDWIPDLKMKKKFFSKIYILQLEEFSALFCYFLMYSYFKILKSD